MRFGVCTGLEHLTALQQAGFDYIEPAVTATLRPEQPQDAVLPAVRAALAAGPLRPEAYNIFLPGDLKVVGETVDRARQDRYLEAAFVRAAALGGQIVVFGSGGARQVPDGFPRGRAWDQLVDFARRAGQAAARHGVRLAVEPLNAGECNILNSVAESLALVEQVAHPAVGVLSDLYHITRDGQDYEETRRAAPRLLHVHVAGAEGRRAPIEDDLEFLAAYFRVLRGSGYAGRISVEGAWQDLPAQAPAALDVLRRAWDAA